MLTKIKEELIQALIEEIETLKNPRGKNRSGSNTRIFNGRFLRETTGFKIYLFNLENFLSVLEDSPAEITINNHQYHAQILLTQGLEVEIGIEGYSGNFIAEATLNTNSWYLLELLKKRLLEDNTNKSIDFGFSESLFLGALLDSRIPIIDRSTINFSLGDKPPNEAQTRAIEASFLKPLSVIWGPPGTGKTRTIAKAVEAHLNAGRSVLLVSHANNAVDEALEDIAEHLQSSIFYQEGKLVRLGISQEEHNNIQKQKYPLLILENIAEKKGEVLVKERRALENEKTQIESSLIIIRDIVKTLEKRNGLYLELSKKKLSLSETLSKLKNLQYAIGQLEEKQKRNFLRLEEAKTAGVFKRFFNSLQPEKIQYEIDKTNILLSTNIRTLEAAQVLQIGLINEIQKVETEYNTLFIDISNTLQKAGLTEIQLNEENNKLDLRKNAILSRIAEINKVLEEIQQTILSEAKLIATTLTKTYCAKQLPNRKFDVVIVDEASMAPLPHLYWAAGLCSSYMTIVGDFLQLPPICISDSPMAQKWLGRSIFDVLKINTAKEAINNEHVTLLDTQYRMVPAISEISNHFVYQGKLKNNFSTTRPDLDDGVSKCPLVMVDTSEINPWCSQISSGGRFNLYHALVSASLAKKIILKMQDCKIGIIVPYKHQARLINKVAKEWGISSNIRINTVHTFQGGEEQIIIFDSTEGSGIPTSLMLDDKQRNSDALRILNVAFTRAKDKLYLIANKNKLIKELHRDSLLSRIIIHFQQQAEMLKSDTFVDNYFNTDFEKWANILLTTPNIIDNPISGTLYTEKNFWAQFLTDIKQIKKRLIILSPFLTINRSRVFMDLFKSMVDGGISITIHTRPMNQQTGDMSIQSDIVLRQLRSIGVSVIERKNMHQKVAIIDDEIAWEGSLNILSHRDTGEQMRRFLGQSIINEIIRNLELDSLSAVGNQTQQVCPGTDGTGCKFGGYLVVKQNHKRGNKFLGCSSYPKCNYTSPMTYSRKHDNKAR